MRQSKLTLYWFGWHGLGLLYLTSRNSLNSVTATAANVFATVPLAVFIAVVSYSEIALSLKGVVLAVISGGFASSIGYVIWFSALAQLTPTTAATVQLSVPVLAASGSVLLMEEPLTLRLFVSSVVVLGGIYLTIMPRYSERR